MNLIEMTRTVRGLLSETDGVTVSVKGYKGQTLPLKLFFSGADGYSSTGLRLPVELLGAMSSDDDESQTTRANRKFALLSVAVKINGKAVDVPFESFGISDKAKDEMLMAYWKTRMGDDWVPPDERPDDES